MGILIAFIIMFFFLFFSYVINEKDIASPSVVIIALFIVSLFFNLLNYEKWNCNFTINYIFVISLGFIATLLGDSSGMYFAKRIKLYRKKRVFFIKDKKIDASKIKVPSWLNIFIISLMILISIIYYNEMLRIARTYGLLSEQTVLQAIRNAIYSVGTAGDLENGISSLLSHATLMCKASAYVYIYIFIYNMIFSKEDRKITKNAIYLIPPIIYLVQSIMTTSRSQILYFLCGVVFIGYLLWYCHNGKLTETQKMQFIKYGVLTIILFCIIFYLLGFLTKKSDTITFFDNISVYVGGSQISLNMWLSEFKETNIFFGEESLVGIRKILNKLSFTDHYVVRHLEFVYFGSFKGNVYTAFRRYLSDFGYIGMFICQFLSTFLFSFLYNQIKKERTASGLIIIYGYISYALAMQAIDELMFSAVFEISNIYILIYGIILYRILIRRKGRVLDEAAIVRD